MMQQKHGPWMTDCCLFDAAAGEREFNLVSMGCFGALMGRARNYDRKKKQTDLRASGESKNPHPAQKRNGRTPARTARPIRQHRTVIFTVAVFDLHFRTSILHNGV